MGDRIRWGILSTANIAVKRFIPGVAKTRNGVVVAIASRNPTQSREVAAKLAIPRSYGSYQDLLADPEVDAIYNALPNSMHAEWTIAAARAGKPVLCEKPLAVDPNQALAMIDACRAANVPLMEAFMYRFHPQHAVARELIDSGAIGDVRFVRSAFTFMLEPFNPANVRLQRDLAGGALMDVGCYCVNAARMIFGEEPQWASAQWELRESFDVDVSLAGTLGFPEGRTAVFDCGFRAAGPGFYSIGGTTGSITVLDAFVPDFGERTILVSDRNGTRVEKVPGADHYAREAEVFADTLLTGQPLPIPPEDAVGTLRAIAALKGSARGLGLRTEV